MFFNFQMNLELDQKSNNFKFDENSAWWKMLRGKIEENRLQIEVSCLENQTVDL
jgi:hypothetical protein